jgi:gliding-associated putative ABC transporter substrate-binding component GldG
MKNRKQLTYSFLLIIGVMVLVNVLSFSFFARLDFTADKRYTLSKATKNILKDLKQPVTITAYFSKDIPSELMNTRREFQDLLVEYSNRSKNKVRFEFVNPSQDDQTEQKAQQAGIQPVMINVREKDQMKQQKVYLGAVIKVGERTDIIPLIQPGAAMEYALSATIKKLSVTDKPMIGLLQGHGEPGLNAMHQAYGTMDIMYNVQPAYLNDTSYALKQYKTLAIVAPKDSIPATHLQQIDRFIAEGGNVLVAFNSVNGDLQNLMGVKTRSNVGDWLLKKGIKVDDSFVIDASCASINAQQQQFGFMVQVRFPFLPVVTSFPKHPVTEGLEAIVLNFANPISYVGDKNHVFKPLATTSDKSNVIPLPVMFDINKSYSAADFPLKGQVIAAALEPENKKEGKMVIISCGNFAVNGEGQEMQSVNPDNVNFFANSIDWMSDQTGLIDLRTKGVTSRLIYQISDGNKTFLKYFNFLFPLALIIGYGIYRSNRNLKLRNKRMEARYV